MDLFNEGSRCRKCGGADVGTIHVSKDIYRADDRREGESFWTADEYMIRRCDRCSWRWRERPLNQATPLEIAQRARAAEKDQAMKELDPL